MSNCCCDKFVMIEGEEDSFETWQGLRGPYYTPSVSEDGTLSWTNNGDLQNPADVNIIGPPGAQGPAGDPGPGVAEGGTTGQLLAKSSDEDFDTEWIDQPEMDAGHVSYDSTETYDDGTVGKELTTINSALSSLSAVTEIIDTASGAIASFPDGSGFPMRSLLATIVPQQDLHGYDAPWAAGAGANQWDEDWEVGDISSATGQNEGNDNLIRSKNYIPITGGSAYYAKVGTVTGNLRARFYDSSKTYIGYQDKSGAIVQCNASFTAPDNASYMRFAVPSGYGNTYNNDISINYPSTVTTYAPYSNECPITGWTGLSGWVEDEYDPTAQSTFSVSWQTEAGTVYGGTIDVVTGVLTADMGIKTELWKNFTSEAVVDTNLIRRQANISSAKGDTENAQKTISNIAPFVRTIADKSVHVSMASSGNYLYAILPTTTDPDLEITFCYPLATPQTYQLTPQQISTLLGNNTVFVDTGSVSVTYQASIKGYIDKVLGS